MYNDYEWCAENIISQKNTLQGIPLAMIDRWIPYFKNDKCVIIENLEEIKEGLWQRICQKKKFHWKNMKY